MSETIGSIRHYPARASFIGYLLVIALGTGVLSLGISRAKDRAPVSLLDAAFTSTSATCVTGLTVRSTGNDFSPIGQLAILLLIQTGGIGILTITTFVTFGSGMRTGLRERAVVAETLGTKGGNLYSVLRSVVRMTLFFEGTGFVILAIRNLFEFPVGQALWQALFHSVSAYCNAGFGLFDDSMTRYQGDWVVNLTITTLVVMGGLGVPVLLDLQRVAKSPWNEWWRRLHLHSKFMLIGTAALLTLGTVSFLILEWDASLQSLPVHNRVLTAFFHSVSARTAGFNTINIGGLTNATLYILVLLMMIGAGPCSTAGGFKVSTLAAVLVRAWSAVRGYKRVNVFGRTISAEAIDRAIVTALMFAVVATVGLTTLLVLEQAEQPHPESQGLFMDALFEVTSALGTVGLSTGMTPHLTSAGRIVIIVLMFVGRLGPIGVAMAISRAERQQPVEFPQEDPLVG